MSTESSTHTVENTMQPSPPPPRADAVTGTRTPEAAEPPRPRKPWTPPRLEGSPLGGVGTSYDPSGIADATTSYAMNS